MADPYHSRGRPYVSNMGQLKFKTPAFGFLEKLSEGFLGPGVEVKRQIEGENLDRLLNPVKPDINPSSPRDIAKYNKQKIVEEHLRRMFAADRRLEEKKKLHPSKRTVPRQRKDELPIRGVLAVPTEKPQPLEVSIPRERETKPKQDVLEIPKEMQPAQEDITIRASKFVVR